MSTDAAAAASSTSSHVSGGRGAASSSSDGSSFSFSSSHPNHHLNLRPSTSTSYPTIEDDSVTYESPSRRDSLSTWSEDDNISASGLPLDNRNKWSSPGEVVEPIESPLSAHQPDTSSSPDPPRMPTRILSKDQDNVLGLSSARASLEYARANENYESEILDLSPSLHRMSLECPPFTPDILQDSDDISMDSIAQEPWAHSDVLDREKAAKPVLVADRLAFCMPDYVAVSVDAPKKRIDLHKLQRQPSTKPIDREIFQFPYYVPASIDIPSSTIDALQQAYEIMEQDSCETEKMILPVEPPFSESTTTKPLYCKPKSSLNNCAQISRR